LLHQNAATRKSLRFLGLDEARLAKRCKETQQIEKPTDTN
jgi:hypothetical protein